MRRNGGTSGLTETRDDVDDTGGEAGLLDQLSGDQGGERGLFGGLEDDAVSGSDGGSDLPCPHEEGEVPRNDLTAHANWLLLDVVEGVGGGVDDLALNLVGPAAVVAESANAHGDVDLGHADGLAVVEGFDRGEEIGVLFKQAGELVQELATVFRGFLPPRALESLAGGGNGDVDILLGGLVDGADDLLGGGVDGLESLAIDTFYELVVDEPGG